MLRDVGNVNTAEKYLYSCFFFLYDFFFLLSLYFVGHDHNYGATAPLPPTWAALRGYRNEHIVISWPSKEKNLEQGKG